MKYQKSLKDLYNENEPDLIKRIAMAGEFSGYRRKSPLLVIVTMAFIGLILGALIYGLVNASQIERAGMQACQAVKDPTCFNH